ncbi:MAG: tRNA-dihydrouridine synthase family protein [Desulfovibrionaceae bacterium]|nr:tRNA-dihydrouridine synthase family protein [Desulfovibrionaceae bacterium]
MALAFPKVSHPTYNLSFEPASPWLAPLAGYSNLPFRLLCRSLGAAAAVTEMVSAKGLIYQSKTTYPLLKTTQDDYPLVVQLFGAEPEFLRDSVKLLLDLGYSFFDLNLGCSVPKVMRQQAGAALLADPKRLLSCAKAMIEAAPERQVGFKLRLGIDQEHELLDLGLELEALGAGWITLHPRYAKQYFKGLADHHKLKILAQKLKIPLVGSGDLLTASQGLNCLKTTGCPTLMYARGALHNPFIFKQHLSLLKNEPPFIPTSYDFKKLLHHFLDLVSKIETERDQTRHMCGLLAALVHGFQKAKEIRKELCAAKKWEELYQIIDHYLG